MKNRILLAALLTILSGLPALVFAQSANYKQPMTINASGQIKNTSGVTIGEVTKDQVIKDAKGHKIAFVDGQGNLVDARTNRKMGRMAKNGDSYDDVNGELLLTVKNNPDNTCDIFDAKGRKIGNVHDSYKGSACALHCFMAGHTHKL